MPKIWEEMHNIYIWKEEIMDRQNEVSNIELLVTAITLLFAMMKFTGMVDWDWLWIFAPLWTLIGLELFTGIVFFGMYKANKQKVINMLKN